MPLYPYTCDDCGNQFEALVRAETKIVPCESCESKKTTRGFGIPAKTNAKTESLPMNACGEGPPCGRSGCGRIR
jgi:putative FmdB family regulatory protein